MKVNSAIILCAGMGNRMGAYGNFLPKPLWPFFQTSLLGLQVHYLKSLGIENIYINLHHQRDLISEYIKKTFPEIKLLIEEEILDVGGGVQNFLQHIQGEPVALAINSDIFISISEATIETATERMLKSNAHASLFLKKVERLDNEGYTEVVTNDKGELISLIKSKEVANKSYNTYVGCSLINNEALPKTTGPSSFFQSVADFRNNTVLGYEVENYFYDLGTLKRYLETSSNLWADKDNDSNELIHFLKTNNLFS